ncbi:Hypothetical predicted protein [Paramuricea clavata]|uniref:Uncharacterized protein n=1 Tax=Paramuricea clavata TaxID=317549 RepID=A0A6S7GMA6_PARCT|nr:Hypothetical predicted protein [Paramuricea clavata]
MSESESDSDLTLERYDLEDDLNAQSDSSLITSSEAAERSEVALAGMKIAVNEAKQQITPQKYYLCSRIMNQSHNRSVETTQFDFRKHLTAEFAEVANLRLMRFARFTQSYKQEQKMNNQELRMWNEIAKLTPCALQPYRKRHFLNCYISDEIQGFRCTNILCHITSTTQKSSSTNQELLSSCKELLQRNRSLSNGVYQLRNTDSLKQYQVYCHMTELSGCGQGGWTLVMKVNGSKNDFSYRSAYWTNKETYAAEDGLEGLNEKQTKLASYWNTPFNKICLGMKVNGVTKWIALNYTANSLHSVIEYGTFKGTTFGKEAWKSLIHGSFLQENCNEEGFNIQGVYKYGRSQWNMNIRIGVVANNQHNCESCNSCIGFGISVNGCGNGVWSTTCGNMAICYQLNSNNTTAFGYILVQ